MVRGIDRNRALSDIGTLVSVSISRLLTGRLLGIGKDWDRERPTLIDMQRISIATIQKKSGLTKILKRLTS